MTCDGSIAMMRDVSIIFRETLWDHLIYVINTQFPMFKMHLFGMDAGRDLWCVFFLFPVICDAPPPPPFNLLSVDKFPSNRMHVIGNGCHGDQGSKVHF